MVKGCLHLHATISKRERSAECALVAFSQIASFARFARIFYVHNVRSAMLHIGQ